MENETDLVPVNEMKEQDMDETTSICNARRKGLSDITNLQQTKAPAKGAKLAIHPASLRSKDYIDKLQQENMTLMKVLAERNKFIELSAIELQKLRTNLEKFQQQNLLLAQANSHMLAELNLGKDRQKALKHELGCKNAVLEAIKSEAGTSKSHKADEFVKENNEEDKPCNTNRCSKSGEPLKGEDGENEPCNKNRRRKAKSLCPSNIKPVQAKEGSDNKRVCLRRQSARFKAQESEVTEDTFAIDDTTVLLTSSCDNKVPENGPSATISSNEEQDEEGAIDKKRTSLRRKSARFRPPKSELTEDVFEGNGTKFLGSLCDDSGHEISFNSSVKIELEEGSFISRTEADEHRRTSVGRPTRRAVERVQSYKEVPINIKMRRTE